MAETRTPSVGKKKYRGFNRQERLVPSVLLALAIPFTLFFFGPFDAYCANLDMLGFAFGDFGWLTFALALFVAAALFAILWNLKGRVFDTVYGVLFAIGFLLFLQGNYLNLGLDAVQGDGVGTATYTPLQTVVNTVIWVLAIGGSVTAFFVVKKKREILRLVTVVATVTVIGVQLITFGVNSLLTDVWVPVAEREVTDTDTEGGEEETVLPGILTSANLTTPSEDGNIIWIVVDRFDIKYYNNYVKNNPDFVDALDGFTLFDNHISKYARTYPSIAYMLTGIENDYSTSRADYFKKAYSEGSFLYELAANGYDINLYTEKFYAYDNADVFSDYAENISSSVRYRVIDRMGLWGDMLRLTLFRYLPICAKGAVGMLSSGDFTDDIEYSSNKPLFDPDMKSAYTQLTEAPFTALDGNKNFTFFHINGCHLPNAYDEDFNEVTDYNDQWDSDLAMRVSFKIVNYYLDELRRLGLYEDATIIITGDHAAAMSDTKDPEGSRVTTLLVKRKGESGTPLKVNSAPVEQYQIRATILASEGITPAEDYGPTVFEIPENSDRKRYYRFQKTVTGGDDELVVYEVVGDAKDFDNWTLVDRINVGNLYK